MLKRLNILFFVKKSKVDDLPLMLPPLIINNNLIKREYNISFLGVILNETLNWKTHIETVESKVSKNIGIIFRAKPFLKLECLKQLYYSFVNSYLNYCNIVWASTNITKLKKLYNKQKHACRIIFGEKRYTSVTHRLKQLGALDIFQLNVYQVLVFMHKIKNGTSPAIFRDQFREINHKYGTRYSENSYVIPKANLDSKRFSICYRGPSLWNSILSIDFYRLDACGLNIK